MDSPRIVFNKILGLYRGFVAVAGESEVNV